MTKTQAVLVTLIVVGVLMYMAYRQLTVTVSSPISTISSLAGLPKSVNISELVEKDGTSSLLGSFLTIKVTV